MVDNLINHDYVMKPLKNPKMMGFKSFQVDLHRGSGSVARPGGHAPSDIPCLMHSFYLAVPELYTFRIKLVIWEVKCFPEFCELFYRINQIQDRIVGIYRLWESLIYSQSARSTSKDCRT